MNNPAFIYTVFGHPYFGHMKPEHYNFINSLPEPHLDNKNPNITVGNGLYEWKIAPAAGQQVIDGEFEVIEQEKIENETTKSV